MTEITGVLNGLVFAVLAVNILYLLFFSIAVFFERKPHTRPILKHNKFAVFIPAYRGDEVIINTVNESFLQSYPRQFYDIIVIGDSLKPLTSGQLRMMPLTLIEVQFENSTKTKALNAALNALGDTDYDYAVVLDIDNIMEKDFLQKLNQKLQKGQLALQAHRMAKNTDTSFAILDAISEEVNNHIFRRGHRAVGLSAALIGSAKAIDYKLFARMMKGAKAIGGFDKELEILLIANGVKIDYDHYALVYDEKVQLAGVFQEQRKRWMSAQLTYLRKYFVSGIVTSVRKRNFDFFDKCIQLILLPRVFTLAILFILTCFYWAGYSSMHWYMLLFALEIFAILVAIPGTFYTMRTLKALLQLPRGIILMFMNVFKMKGANKKFIHTPHGVNKEEL